MFPENLSVIFQAFISLTIDLDTKRFTGVGIPKSRRLAIFVKAVADISIPRDLVRLDRFAINVIDIVGRGLFGGPLESDQVFRGGRSS